MWGVIITKLIGWIHLGLESLPRIKEECHRSREDVRVRVKEG